MMSRESDALAAADRLSREGNFVEAMHVLLLHSLAEIRRQLGEKFADSLTSREILRVARLTAPGLTSLREIVAAVERTYFGAYPAAAGDYAACLRGLGARVVRSRRDSAARLDPAGVLIVAEPSPAVSPQQMSTLMNAHTVLLILPKWTGRASPSHRGWISSAEPLPDSVARSA